MYQINIEELEDLVHSINESKHDPGECLDMIKDAILHFNLMAFDLVRKHGSKHMVASSKAYWFPAIEMACSDDHDWLGKEGSTITEMVKRIKNKDLSDDDENDE